MFFPLYITNDRTRTADEIVMAASDRCDQENLIAQLNGGVHALTTPVNDLMSNWAYMVMASLARSLKAWSALMVPVSLRHTAKHEAERRTWLRMEFATFSIKAVYLKSASGCPDPRLMDLALGPTFSIRYDNRSQVRQSGQAREPSR